MTDVSRIRVVSAAIISRPVDGPPRVLLGQRGPAMDCPLKWCTPGGKLRFDEVDSDALRRELREEISVDVPTSVVPTLIGEFSIDPPRVRKHISLHMYKIDAVHVDGPSLSFEIVGVGWFTAADLVGLDLCPADHDARPLLTSLLAP